MSREPSLFRNLGKLKPAWGGQTQHVSYDDLLALFDAEFDGFVRSSRSIDFEADFDPRDIVWNHTDFSHRPYVHGHFARGVRVALGSDVAVALTPLGRLPFLVPTFDLRCAENEFSHFFSLGGLVSAITRMKIIEAGSRARVWRFEWTLVSKWYLKPLHFFVHCLVARENRRLFAEDLPVKTWRKQLRSRGYRFVEDGAGFFSNTRLDVKNVVAPAAPPLEIALSTLEPGSRQSFKTGGRELLVTRQSREGQHDRILVWDSVCPHQGGPLQEASSCGEKQLTCPWHGLKIEALEVSVDQPTAEGAWYALKLSGDNLVISPKAGTNA